MALVIVVEDTPEIRDLMRFVLLKDGYDVLVARDGRAGLALVRQHKPDLVVSDVQMPEMNGFELVMALRKDPQIATTPVILLTALQERADMREGMNAGADDFITKPFTPRELSDAVAAQLNKRGAVSRQLLDQKNRLAALYEQRLAHEMAQLWPTGSESAEGDESFGQATALFVDIVGYGALAERLDADELSALVKRFYGGAGDTMYLFGARHMHFVGEGLLAVFAEDNDTRSVSHGQRALRAALGLQDVATAMRRLLEHQHPGRGLPQFRISSGLHTGPVTLARLQDPIMGTAAQTLPVGEAVGIARRLQQQADELGWAIVASQSMLDAVNGMASTGTCAVVDLPGSSKGVAVCEVTGLRGP
jgi:CheY-like chemotaxis protein